MWRVRDEGPSRDGAKVREAVGHHALSPWGIELCGRMQCKIRSEFLVFIKYVPNVVPSHLLWASAFTPQYHSSLVM